MPSPTPLTFHSVGVHKMEEMSAEESDEELIENRHYQMPDDYFNDDNDYWRENRWWDSVHEYNEYMRLRGSFNNYEEKAKFIFNIDNDALDPNYTVEGSIYKTLAFGTWELGQKGLQKYFFTPCLYLTVILIQTLGPWAIVVYYWKTVYSCNTNLYTFSNQFQSQNYSSETLPARILGSAFMFAIGLWSVKAMDGEKETAQKAYDVFYNFFAQENPPLWFFLHLGSLINFYLIFMSPFITFLVLGPIKSPADIIFGALSIMFIVQLDNADGDLAIFGDESWNDQQMGWCWKSVAEDKKLKHAGDAIHNVEDLDEPIEDPEPPLSHQGEMIGWLFKIGHHVMMLIAIVVTVLYLGMPWNSMEEECPAEAPLTTTPMALITWASTAPPGMFTSPPPPSSLTVGVVSR
eukprot:gnl/MRDRNA2_/MRDRNA2_79921_c0_seq1.p1 gnl/MRDRNA2_/MRDRNA2_79921_c0~~gnl/MRDRNA2_/MRDRNA2_79921_c0_seq1.p1  ORF type:complete len:476 (+),score=71.57 gnl/MRDRNA2_/MRDRNA2_79921_c0_seq1:215-1429(+)